MAGLKAFSRLLDDPTTAWVLGVLAAGQLAAALRRLRGTTLVAPVLWGLAAVAMLVVSAVLGAADTPADHYLGYAAAIFLLAPGLAVLGAKRPQSGAWQFIVATFVGMLMLPVFNGLTADLPEPHPHALLRWLNLAVFVVGACNYLPTIQFVPIGATWLGAGMLLGVCIPGGFGRSAAADVWALLGLNIGLAVAWVIARRRRGAARGMQRLWSDFRDAYGAVWGVRVAERLNVAARRHGWPVTFAWRGIRPAEPDDVRSTGSGQARSTGSGQAENPPDALQTELFKSSAAPWNGPLPELTEILGRLDPDLLRRIRREFHALLRRFVSAAWIAERDTAETEVTRLGRGVSAGGEHTG